MHHYERLSATDTTFLRVETPHEPQHVGSLSVLEGGPLRDEDGRIQIDELRDHVARRIDRVPRLRQKLMEVPLAQGRPVWVDDDTFDIEYHVRVTSLPVPGDDEQLNTLMSRLQEIALDRDRPLWEMWFVDGLEGGDVGLIIKTHHALGDGIANVDLALALVDLGPNADDEHEPIRWRARPAPSSTRLLADSFWDQVTLPARVAKRSLGALRNPRPAIDAAVGVVRTATEFLKPADPAPWNQPVGAHRRWVPAAVPMETIAEVRDHHDVTVNDVVLAACTSALREFLLARGERVTDRHLDAMVPISIRAEDEHGGTLGNRISMVLVRLPVDEADPIERLRRIHETTTELKASNLVDGAELIIQMAHAITPIAAPLARLVSRRIPMNLVITNIPGPAIPLYLRGARIERTHPYVEVIDKEGLTMAVVSYCDHLYFGLTADRDVMPDLAELARGIEGGFAELARAAAPSQDKKTKRTKKSSARA